MSRDTAKSVDTVVFHLVRAGTELDVLSRFVRSYECFSAGSSHRLEFLLKGFPPDLPASLSKLLDSVAHDRLICPNRGFDLGTYIFASRRAREHLAMFTNSFSVLQSDRWLAKFLDAYLQPRVGLVGATGSWESLSSHFLNERVDPSGSLLRSALAKGKALTMGLPLLALFPPFPNIHLRTNGFLLSRKHFLEMSPLLIRTKLDAWLFESGRHSLTRKMLARGLNVRVVGCDGFAYEPSEWHRSGTFWQSQQENLLIHDNRTIAYERGGAEYRTARSQAAWGRFPAAVEVREGARL